MPPPTTIMQDYFGGNISMLAVAALSTNLVPAGVEAAHASRQVGATEVARRLAACIPLADACNRQHEHLLGTLCRLGAHCARCLPHQLDSREPLANAAIRAPSTIMVNHSTAAAYLQTLLSAPLSIPSIASMKCL